MGIKSAARMFLLMASLASTTTAWSAEIHGRSSTQFLSFNNEWLNDQRQTELAEYLRLSITNIDKAGKFSIHGYGRASQDLSNGEGLNGRLYYLYGEYRDLYDKLDVRAGRQFVNLAAGSAIMDGAQVDLKNVGPVAFTVLGGRDVVFGLNGEIGDATNTVLGLGAYLTGFQKTDLEVSWFRKWDGGDISRDIIGVMGKQYLFNNLQVYGNARYDLPSETFNEVQAGVRYYPTSDLILTAEYFQSYPQFDTTSIYSVFAVNRYAEGVFRVDYTINDKVAVNGGYNRQGYGDGAHADVYFAGVGVRPIEPLRVNLEYDKRSGYYGSLDGVIIDAAYDITKVAQVAAGFNYDVYERDALTGDEIARRYWAGGKYKIANNMALSGRIQNDVNERYSSNVSGRVTFDYDF
ncbi:hypothetical protein [Geobacter sp. DSM 9736]|uniref:hypothetical protein n=1 Tax=Geobacter sp. DSM 9736 TaxID=1277350 RepID=UPI000B50D1F0|nr:hypothetical protein [Geobacter sp. DSM 9736]SNB46355.1 hypothetical protein SAMN06269301_1810 [Geobacter sp. DSM 9736]